MVSYVMHGEMQIEKKGEVLICTTYWYVMMRKILCQR